MDVQYYVGPKGRYDLFKIRDECERRQKGDFYSDPALSVIHFHLVGEECNGRCESYPAKANREVETDSVEDSSGKVNVG